jgi:hypothetical protein
MAAMHMFSITLNSMKMIKELQQLSHLYTIHPQVNMPEKLTLMEQSKHG